MDITQALANLKKEPGFSENVGMVLVHNGVIRGWSRPAEGTEKKNQVKSVKVTTDNNKLNMICQELQKRPGIFRILAHGNSGEFMPGDDVLFLVVAGDIRENVKTVFAELLDRVKNEAINKKENIIL